MLVMSTEKYPDEKEYTEYVKNSGGHNNAFTTLVDTVYYFESSN